jgi:hypothetical protein
MIGVGARDGESLPLEDLLRIRLGARDDWPVATWTPCPDTWTLSNR